MKIKFMNMNGVNNFTLDTIKESIEFFANELFSKKMKSNIEIIVSYEPDLYANGTCEWNDYWIKPREFLIKIKNIDSIGEAIHTISHEMIHVNQFVTEKLKDRFFPKKHKVWDKTKFYEDIEYYDSPWEKDAYAKQDELFFKYVDYKYEQERIDPSQSVCISA